MIGEHLRVKKIIYASRRNLCDIKFPITNVPNEKKYININIKRHERRRKKLSNTGTSFLVSRKKNSYQNCKIFNAARLASRGIFDLTRRIA